jgi:predicted ferric reductase
MSTRTPQNLKPILLTVGITLAIWIGSKWYYQDPFANPYKYVAKFGSLAAITLMCWSILLSTRWRFLEVYFGGLDTVYQIHKRIGRWAFFLILLHPVFLAVDRLPDIVAFLRAMWFLRPRRDAYLWGQNVGVVTLIAFAGLIAVTLWIKIPYHIWKRTHEWFGLVLLLIIVHILLVSADVAAYPLLTVWVYGLLGLAAVGFVYIRFLYWRIGPRFPHAVSGIEKTQDIIKATFAPLEKKMDFRPSQFVYLVVHKEGITPEPHPYSIASGYNLPAEFKLGIKKLGDHTRTLDRLEKGDHVTVYGPYGRFSEKFLQAERDCVFVAGGIGITAFIGMWHVALHSEDLYDPQEVPAPLGHLHPEIIKTWKSPLVSLFYAVATAEEASFDSDIRNEVVSSHFQGFEAFEQRGHHYELYLSDPRGNITAEYLDEHVAGGVRNKNIFLCGPPAMVDALIPQLKGLGVTNQQIIIEDFDLV